MGMTTIEYEYGNVGNDDNPTIIMMMMMMEMEIILTSMPKTFKASFWRGGDGYCTEDDDLVKKCASCLT